MRYLALEGGIGRLEDDGTVAVLGAGTTLAVYLEAGGRLADLAGVAVVDRTPLDGLALGPVTLPAATTWGIGLNYRSKQEATGRSLPDRPTLFSKAASACPRPGGPIRIPPTAPACVDYEGEIAVVLQSPLFDSSPQEAAAAVGAVAAANDVTARDVMRETGNPSLAKSFPGFGQLGSAVIDPAESGGFDAISLRTSVNGGERQSDTGAGMILPVGDLLSLLSRHVLLRPGDVVLTGTPAGTGDETKTYLGPGDVVEVAIAGLPALRSPVVDGRAGQPG
ncbi:MAG: fumarylacetoacetate hydrolase family protein [Acidimicrobiales bacterium]